MPGRSLEMGAGGVALDIRLTRISTYTERYYIFPMVRYVSMALMHVYIPNGMLREDFVTRAL
jgi:hypothetical protein